MNTLQTYRRQEYVALYFCTHFWTLGGYQLPIFATRRRK